MAVYHIVNDDVDEDALTGVGRYAHRNVMLALADAVAFHQNRSVLADPGREIQGHGHVAHRPQMLRTLLITVRSTCGIRAAGVSSRME